MTGLTTSAQKLVFEKSFLLNKDNVALLLIPIIQPCSFSRQHESNDLLLFWWVSFDLLSSLIRTVLGDQCLLIMNHGCPPIMGSWYYI